MTFKYLLAFLIVGLAVSRLILPSQIAKLQLESLRRQNPHLSTQKSPSDNSSSANPVEGIANATSGYISVNDPNSNSKLFYVFFQCRGLQPGQNPTDVPLIIWLQGGPGGSSLTGLFYEEGPYNLTQDPNTGKWQETRREVSWNDHYNIVYIDQPRGTGYSIADNNSYVTTEDEVAQDFVNALQNFYALDAFSGYTQTPLFIFGESYAGHYIPSIGQAILQYNAGDVALKFPLKGLAIGDGFTDPVHQMAENALFGYTMGLLDEVQRAQVESYQLDAVTNVYNKDWLDAQSDFDNIMNLITTDGGNLNVYNFRDFGNYDFTPMDTFMNDPDTVTRYNVDPSVAGQYSDINMNVYNALSNDFMQSVAPRVAFIAESGLPIMFYNGQDDIICNTPGVENWITNLPWSGQTQLYDAEFNVWFYQNGTNAGLQKNYNNFFFVIVNKAGHLSPMDQINTTTEMVQRFINGQTNWTEPLNGSSKKEHLLEM